MEIKEAFFGSIFHAAAAVGLQHETPAHLATPAIAGSLFNNPGTVAPAEAAKVCIYLNREERRAIGRKTHVVEVSQESGAHHDLLESLTAAVQARRHRELSTGRRQF